MSRNCLFGKAPRIPLLKPYVGEIFLGGEHRPSLFHSFYILKRKKEKSIVLFDSENKTLMKMKEVLWMIKKLKSIPGRVAYLVGASSQYTKRVQFPFPVRAHA